MDNQIKTTSQDKDDVFHHVELNLDEYPIKNVLNILLQDKTTGKNIIWATSSYQDRGEIYADRYEITKEAILGENKILIQPRAFKNLEDQQERTKSRAEVFTPSWIVNKMINQIDNEWFGKENVFNYEIDQSWNSNKAQKIFKTKKEAEQYIQRRVLEITCGEAPFLTSRYDASTGQIIPLQDRIGLLDRKMRAVQEKWTEKDWIAKARKAYKNTYGYEFQGDNLLIARINLLLTFVENYECQFGKRPNQKILDEIADIISWNISQMDGLSYCVPLGEPKQIQEQVSFLSMSEIKEESPLCTYKTWTKTKQTSFVKNIREEGVNMAKFDFVIGNPPYQIQDNGNGSSSKPIYQNFVLESEKICNDTTVMITPSRWFNGGKGLDSFRNNMLNSGKLTRIVDYQNAKDCFPNVSIGGGVNYFAWKANRDPHDTDCLITNIINGNANTVNRSLTEFPLFVRYNKSVEIIKKVMTLNEKSIVDLMSARNPFGLPTNTKGKTNMEKGDLHILSSKGDFYLSRNALSEKINPDFISNYKVMVSRVTSEHAGEPDKSGKYKVIAKMLVLEPDEVCTDSYIIGGPVKTKLEALNLYKYLSTKFVRFLILQTLSSINLSRESYRFVPTQDFTEEWTDQKLYEKYQLSEEEISLIEDTIKPLN